MHTLLIICGFLYVAGFMVVEFFIDVQGWRNNAWCRGNRSLLWSLCSWVSVAVMVAMVWRDRSEQEATPAAYRSPQCY